MRTQRQCRCWTHPHPPRCRRRCWRRRSTRPAPYRCRLPTDACHSSQNCCCAACASRTSVASAACGSLRALPPSVMELPAELAVLHRRRTQQQGHGWLSMGRGRLCVLARHPQQHALLTSGARQGMPSGRGPTRRARTARAGPHDARPFGRGVGHDAQGGVQAVRLATACRGGGRGTPLPPSLSSSTLAAGLLAGNALLPATVCCGSRPMPCFSIPSLFLVPCYLLSSVVLRPFSICRHLPAERSVCGGFGERKKGVKRKAVGVK